MEKSILNIALNDLAEGSSTSEENFEMECSSNCCKAIKVLLEDKADIKKDMAEKMNHIKSLEDKITTLQIESSINKEKGQLLNEKIKDKDDVIAALKSSVEMYKTIKVFGIRPSETLDHIIAIQNKLDKLSERKISNENMEQDSNLLNKTVKTQSDYITDLQSRTLNDSIQLKAKDDAITSHINKIKQKDNEITKLQNELITYKKNTEHQLKAYGSKTADYENTIKQLKANAEPMAESKKLLSIKMKEVKTLKDKVRLYETQLKSLTQSTSKNEPEAFYSVIKDLKAKLASCENRNQQLVDSNQLLRTKHAKEITELKNGNEYETRINEYQNHIEKLKTNINAVVAKWNQSKEENLEYKRDNLIYKDQVIRINNKLTEANATVSSHEETIKELKRKIIKLKEYTEKKQNDSDESAISFQLMQIDGLQPFVVAFNDHLTDESGSWMIIQRRIDGAISFDRFWTDYSKGFGDNSREFWLGLGKLHVLTTKQRHELYIQLIDLYNQVRYARYDNFVIASEAERYALQSLGNYIGNSGDLMRKYETLKFDVHDSTGGWWYINEDDAHLNGRYVKTQSKDLEHGLYIGTWYFGCSVPLKSIKMLIRPYEENGKKF